MVPKKSPQAWTPLLGVSTWAWHKWDWRLGLPCPCWAPAWISWASQCQGGQRVGIMVSRTMEGADTCPGEQPGVQPWLGPPWLGRQLLTPAPLPSQGIPALPTS